MAPFCAAHVAYNASSAAPYEILQRIEPAIVQSLEGGPATCAVSSAGISSSPGGTCVDLGAATDNGRWRQLSFMPDGFGWRQKASAAVVRHAGELQSHLTRLQWGDTSTSCAASRLYTVGELPTIGFCATIEYGMLALARAAASGAKLVLGPRSAPTWSSPWLCGPERSLGCYFNVSASCCGDAVSFARGASEENAANGGIPLKSLYAKLGRSGRAPVRPRTEPPHKRRLHRMGAAEDAKLARRAAKLASANHAASASGLEYGWSRAPSLGGALAPHNRYGTLWVSGQLARWLFDHMHPRIRADVDRRRADVLPRRVGSADAAAPPLCIGMHVRRGDSCSLGSRFCPRDREGAYFAAAARLRAKYGINRLVVATDDARAAALCAGRALGFDCRTRRMDRQRFDARASIERRVVKHADGPLSGSEVSLDTLADVEMLSECDAHVLVLRSAVSRLALALSVATKGRHAPLISLQWPWGGRPGGPAVARAAG